MNCGTKRVLVADATSTDAEKLASLLRSKSWTVQVAPSLEQVAESKWLQDTGEAFCAVVLGLQFPGTSASPTNLLHRLRARDHGPYVIIATETDSHQEVRALLKAGDADAYVFKPNMRGHPWEEEVCHALEAYRLAEALDEELNNPSGWLCTFVHRNLDVGISVVDRSHRLRYVNQKQLDISRQGVCRGGTCWMEYNGHWDQEGPCPWCPVREVFEDGQFHEDVTISPIQKNGNGNCSNRAEGSSGREESHFYSVAAHPIRLEPDGEVIAAVEIVRDITDPMVRECRGAILEGKEAFRREMTDMLERICHLGFDRARLYMLSPDPQYLEGFAVYGEHENVDIVGHRLNLEQDDYSRWTRDSGTPICPYDGTEGCPDPQLPELRPDGQPWIEVQLSGAGAAGKSHFVGKISIDNAPSGRDLKSNKQYYWGLLRLYAAMLGQVVADANEHFLHEQHARQMMTLREMDQELAAQRKVDGQMETIVRYVNELLKPDHCHIRRRVGSKLVLAGQVGAERHVRKAVHVRDDAGTSVSVEQANAKEPARPTVWTEEELKKLAGKLRTKGRPGAAEQFEQMRTCAVFGLLDSDHTLIGTLVIDSRTHYFFDTERLSVARDFVNRAQVLVESNLRRQSAENEEARIRSLLDALPSQVAVMDRQARVQMQNIPWLDRLGHRSRGTSPADSVSYAAAAWYVESGSSNFDAEVRSVFDKGRTARLAAAFRNAKDETRQMDVTLAPFDRGAGNRVTSVAVILSDVQDQLDIEALSQRTSYGPDLKETLREPVRQIRELFKADRVSVVEFLGASTERDFVHRWSVDERRDDIDARHNELRSVAIGRIGWLKDTLKRDRYLAFPDLDGSDRMPADLQKIFSEDLRIRALLAVPVFLRSEEWGALIVEAEQPRDFSGRDVDLLQSAAAQLSIILIISQEMELRAIDRQLVEKIEAGKRQVRQLLRDIIGHAGRLTVCDLGGHIRTADWFRGQLVLRAATDPFLTMEEHPFRQRVKIGERVAGVVAARGKRHVVQNAATDEFTKHLPAQVPEGRDDINDFVARQRSYVCMPLIADGEIFGTFSLAARQVNHFTAMRMRALEDFASRAAVALRAVDRLNRMHRMAALMNNVLKIDALQDLWPKVPGFAAELFLAEDASISEYDPATDLLCRRGRYNQRIKEAGKDGVGCCAHPTAGKGCGLTLFVAKTGQALRLAGDTLTKHENLSPANRDYAQYYPSRRVHSVMVRRLQTPDGKVMGVLKVENRKGRVEDGGFTEFDEILMELACAKFAIAIERLRLMEARNRAIVTQTHDLKTPLHAVNYTLDCFARERFTLPRNEDMLLRSARAVKLLDALIYGTIDVAQGRIDPKRIKPEEINTQAVIDEALEVLAERFRQSEWEVTPRVADSASRILFDEKQFLRLLLNLCHNAWKHGGWPEDKLALGQHENSLDVTVRTEGDRCILEVADRGPGLAAPSGSDYLADSQDTKGGMGHGIGLAACRLIAQAHGGEFRIGPRSDGSPGALATVRWDQAALRQRYEKRKQEPEQKEGRRSDEP